MEMLLNVKFLQDNIRIKQMLYTYIFYCYGGIRMYIIFHYFVPISLMLTICLRVLRGNLI